MSPRQPDLQLFDTPSRAPADPVGHALNRLDARRKARPNYEVEYAYQCRSQRLPEPLEQYPFAKELGRRFTADFGWTRQQIPTLRRRGLLVEIQGGIWRPGGGAHSHPIDIERDIERQQYIAMLDLVLLPVTPKQVTSGRAIELTMMVLEKLGWEPPCAR